MPRMPRFDNRLTAELPGDTNLDKRPRQVHGALWSPVSPTPVSAPRLLCWSPEVAAALGLSAQEMQSPQWLAALSGNGLQPGMFTYATCYGGHQFGNWAGQLGDGRAIFLGEAVNGDGQRFELQLKGAGPTPYSRRADGRAVLRSSIREFLCSEAMHHLGVPTTRALSLVVTGEAVVRDMFYDGHPTEEPGAIVCRVAPSFTRFGHFELPAARDDVPLLNRLIEFTLSRDFPEIVADTAPEERLARWFTEICERTARLMVHWMRVGFVHGVMNTDNLSILGLTIDYGPYGWIDNFDPAWTPNTTDAQGRRYCFGRQPAVARWNLERLAESLAVVVPDHASLEAGLAQYNAVYSREFQHALAAKFGFTAWRDEDAQLVEDCFDLLQAAEIDMTLFFRGLAAVDPQTPTSAALANAFYDSAKRDAHATTMNAWLARWVERVRADREPARQRQTRMNAVNPCYVLRNYLAQEAIDLAEQGDPGRIGELLDVLRQPYVEQHGKEHFAEKRPDWARQRPGCSMLSCSS